MNTTKVKDDGDENLFDSLMFFEENLRNKGEK